MTMMMLMVVILRLIKHDEYIYIVMPVAMARTIVMVVVMMVVIMMIGMMTIMLRML